MREDPSSCSKPENDTRKEKLRRGVTGLRVLPHRPEELRQPELERRCLRRSPLEPFPQYLRPLVIGAPPLHEACVEIYNPVLRYTLTPIDHRLLAAASRCRAGREDFDR